VLADKLRAQIRADGPVPFEQYMAACLYDEEFGFFTTGPLRSVKSGDFLTSPEVSPWFGRMLARFVAKEQERTGADPFLVVEVGAGSGSLLRPLIEELRATSLSSSSPSGGGVDEGAGGGQTVTNAGRPHVPPAEGRGDVERSDAGGYPFSTQPYAAQPSSTASSDHSFPPPQGEVPTKEAEGVMQLHTEPSDPPSGLAAGLPPEGAEENGGLRPADSHSYVPTRSDSEVDASGAAPSVPPRGGGTRSVSDAGGPSYKFHAVEASPAAREALTDLLCPDHIHSFLANLPDRFDGVIIANELLDNLPVALAIRSGDGWVERWVGATDDRFGFVTAPVRPEVAAWCNAYAGEVSEGGMVEVQLQAMEWIKSALETIDHGALVIIDYGGTAEELEPRRTQGTLRTYRSHHLGPDPLLEPGATDVTVDVNFTAAMMAAESAGATVDLHRQDDFLASLGLRYVIQDFRHRERDLARSGHAMERLIVRSEATDAETLLHPRGLGDFRAMVARID
jgi:SAM-dependent MidA family methyltransferase